MRLALAEAGKSIRNATENEWFSPFKKKQYFHQNDSKTVLNGDLGD
jgi:hypothetical protein